MLHCDWVNNRDTYFTQYTVGTHVSNGGTYCVQSVNNESTYPIRGAALHRCAPIRESWIARNWCMHHGPAMALGQPLIQRELCIVIHQHHTLSASPGSTHLEQQCDGSELSKATQPRGRMGGRCLKYANRFSALDFSQFRYPRRFFCPRNKKYVRKLLKSLSAMPRLKVGMFTWLLCSLVVSNIQYFESFMIIAVPVCDKWLHILLCTLQITMAVAQLF